MEYFKNIIGQDKTINKLKKIIDSDNISHAYLFIGKSGIGKMLTARAFSNIIINKDDKSAQIYLKDNIHPDLLIIEKKDNKTVVTKEQITQELESWIAVKPYRAKRKIAIIRDSHLMSLEASNALLKTLEEPPPYASIILIADENNLLETIISRCQAIRFNSVTEDKIEAYLTNKLNNKENAPIIACLSQGSLANAIMLAEENKFEKLIQDTEEIIKALSKGQNIAIFEAAEKIEADIPLIASCIETILRDIYIYKKTQDEQIVLIKNSIKIAKQVPNLTLESMSKAINNINKLKRKTRNNINPMLIGINISYELFDAFIKKQ
ncbi:hypothetical protein SYNTR_1988 [Candidatus Syntrophocurvum alkaliphilum]|uniref:DNA-directed DNA polymerase n=1 Tax=Candidatus Syntrophocurvum alkaliphilum TaxID=2293317 RepID=A0A6I6DDK1_9FIRM|nr:DNA polymerase III subunit delta' [Candidatus Syntrophocurvum alkaliphilum]QGU00582.1 hypothetical protein SYNTR_1988 [Candidatus Syntrophocurvum alkaliphilum]